MTVQFQDTHAAFSLTLANAAARLHETPVISIRQLLTHFGEQALLFLCVILTLPFLTPIPLPILNFILGVPMIRFSIGIIFNHTPALSAKVMKNEIRSEKLIPALDKITRFFRHLEHWVHPRLPMLTQHHLFNRLNGITLFLGALLFVFPFDSIPLADTLPAWGILLLALGMLQRDGLVIITGYLVLLLSLVYIGLTISEIMTSGIPL